MKTLIIAEKPSVARSIAQALGVTGRQDGYIENDSYSVSWCCGHLVGLADAAAYNERYKKWDIADLPLIPQTFRYAPLHDARARLAVLKRLMNRPDVRCVVNACDAGREGELIFRLVYSHVGCRKPVTRLWISSMEPEAIRQGIADAADSSDYDGLYASALCRQQADWLIGINATRLFTGLDGILRRVGRVVTPTLRLLYDRALEIEKFQAEKYFRVQLDLKGGLARSERLPDKVRAEDLTARCRADTAICSNVETQRKREASPRLFDLTSLQREANRLLGLTAQQTLDLAQSLYEHRFLTYPRTDSRFLTDDMAGAAMEAAVISRRLLGLPEDERLDPRSVLNPKKVSDHHAIIPTGTVPDLAKLPENERRIYSLCAVRLVCAMLPPMEYEATKAVFSCAGATFTAKGRRILSAGWKAAEKAYLACVRATEDNLEADGGDDEESGILPAYTVGEKFPHPPAIVTEHTTKPPRPFTEASLLAAMERAGAAATTGDSERKGLGTPATRASILEKLVSDGCIERKGKTLRILPSGRELIETLPEDLKNPAMTSEWENELTLIAKGEHPPGPFMERIQTLVHSIVSEHKDHPRRKKADSRGVSLGTCPRCGGSVYEGRKSFYCENWRTCGFSMFKDSRFFQAKKVSFTPAIAKALLRHGRSHQKKLWSECTGRTYEADILLQDDGKHVNFALDFGSRAQKSRKKRS